MKITLVDKELDKKQEQHIEELITKYKNYLNLIDDWAFVQHGVHLVKSQLALIALSVEKAWFMNRDKSQKELLVLMSIAGVKATCEMFCMPVPDEIEIDDETLKVVR